MTATVPLTPTIESESLPLATDDLLAEPTFEECVEEYTRYFKDRDAGLIAIPDAYDGQHVAYFARQIHGHDADPTALRARVAAALCVHPARIVVNYPWAW